MFVKIEELLRSNRVFSFLVLFRWASVLPALATLSNSPTLLLSPAIVVSLAVLVNLGISLFHRPLNRLVTNYPLLLLVDLGFAAGLISLSGGTHSPYFLYALSPLLAGAFFFQIRGALGTAIAFTPLYTFAIAAARQWAGTSTGEDLTLLFTQLAGIWLIPILFAYPSLLLKTLHQTSDQLALARDKLTEQNESLSTAHKQLRVIHELTVLLQAAPDLLSVQQRVLGAVTTGLGFRKAIVALVDPAREEIGEWMLHPVNSSFPKTAPLPLNVDSGAVVHALLERQRFNTDGYEGLLVSNPILNSWLKTSPWMVIPLFLREHAVGVLLVETDKTTTLPRPREEALTNVANQAALALGTTILCIDRARRLAVETERNRIARDIHDTVAQSLFGIVYSLEACINMLPAQADEVKTELTELRSLASNAHEEVRRSIFNLWPSALTMDIFQTDLVNYVGSCCRPRTFSIIFNHTGDFDSLSPGLRRTIYRMAQEALANAARYSGADSARLCLNVHASGVDMSISDEGRGFDPAIALSRSVNREHFGLHGIQERARALGGDCQIVSAPGKGARILIELPANGNQHG